MLSREGRPTGLGDAFAHYGRIFKTLHLLQFLHDEPYRRMITAQLNVSEGRHQLARKICFGNRGELKQRYREGLEDQLGALGLVLNAVVWWNSLYVEVVRGNRLAHADLHPRNILIDRTDRTWVVDWAWPTVASALVTPTCLAVQLVSSGHDPAEVEKLLAASTLWGRLDLQALAVFARADVLMHRHYAKIRPEQEWRKALADAAQRWADHWIE